MADLAEEVIGGQGTGRQRTLVVMRTGEEARDGLLTRFVTDRLNCETVPLPDGSHQDDALDIARRALTRREADQVLIGAVTVPGDPDDQARDVAVALLMRRHPDTSEVIAVVDEITDEPPGLRVLSMPASGGVSVTKGARTGDIAATGGVPVVRLEQFSAKAPVQRLLGIAVAAAALRHRVLPVPGHATEPLLGGRTAEVIAESGASTSVTTTLRGAAPAPLFHRPPPSVHVFSGRNAEDALAAARSGRESDTGPARLVLLGTGDDLAGRRDAAARWLAGSGPRPQGVAFRTVPLEGKLAFVYTNGAAAYPSMGRDLMLAFPETMDDIRVAGGPIERYAGWAFHQSTESPTALERIWATGVLCWLHTRLCRSSLGLEPDAVVGYSAGESLAPVCLGMWEDVAGLIDRMREDDLLSRELTGEHRAAGRHWAGTASAGDRWITFAVQSSPDRVREALRGETTAYLMTINSPTSCVIGGAESACARVLTRLGAAEASIPVDYDIAVHGPVVESVRQRWRTLHDWPLRPLPGVEFYSAGRDGAYRPTRETLADALTGMAVRTVDFPAMIERAWNDGVRVFVEFGPRGWCSRWITETLGDRPHLAVPLDGRGQDGVTAFVQAAADLIAAGIPVRTDRLPCYDDAPASGGHPVGGSGTSGPEPSSPAVPQARRLPPAPRLPVEIPTGRPAAPASIRPGTAASPLPVRGHRLVTAVQHGYVTSQAQAQARFLDVCRQALNLLLGAPPAVAPGEFTVEAGAWYLDHCGRLPSGMLLLIAQGYRMPADRPGLEPPAGERPRSGEYEIIFHGEPPRAGQILLHTAGTVRCGPSRSGAGLSLTIGDVHDPEPPPHADHPEPPETGGAPGRYAPDAVRAFAEGRLADCFGPAWDQARSHVRSARTGHRAMLLFDEVTELDPAGGPRRRGRLRAHLTLTPGSWFLVPPGTDGPCVPEGLLLEGCLQVLGFFLSATGFTLRRDGWRFEPVPDRPYRVLTRPGRAGPGDGVLAYRVLVSDVVAGPLPAVYADVVCDIGGTRVFHVSGLGLRLVPDWPLDHWGDLGEPRVQADGVPLPPAALGGLRGHRDPEPVARMDGVALGYRAMLAVAWGRAAEGCGQRHARLDGPHRWPRLPGPPFMFLSRVTRLSGPPEQMRAGVEAEFAHDLPERAWFWDQAGSDTAPLTVLLETALQPCGWLMMYIGCILGASGEVLFRNLEGTGSVHRAIGRDTGTLRTRVQVTDLSRQGTVMLVGFAVECRSADGVVFTGATRFGVFPPEALHDQVGLRTRDEQRRVLDAPSDHWTDLAARPERYCAGALRLPGPMLLMLDRVTGFWPDGGAAGLGRLRAEKDIDPGAWYFRSHFFQDPVQPGSLGVEAMRQLLAYYMIETGLGEGMRRPRFETPPGCELVWTYRGQVTPATARITVELEITGLDRDDDGPRVVAEGRLWADGLCVYHVRGLAQRIVSDRLPTAPDVAEWTIDPGGETWLYDHRPTWTIPALPLMTIADRIAAAAGGLDRGRIRLRDVRMSGWALVPGPTRMRTETRWSGDTASVTVSSWQEKESRYVAVAAGKVERPAETVHPEPLPPLAAPGPAIDPYAEAFVFNGPSFQCVTALRVGTNGASGTIDPRRCHVPHGTLGQGLLDAVIHTVPNTSLWRWSEGIPRGMVAFPHRLAHLEVHEPLPHDRPITTEVRFAGFDDGDVRRPMIDCHMLVEGRLAVEFRFVGAMLPIGRLSTDFRELRVFMDERRYAGGIGVAATTDGTTRVRWRDVAECDWLPGTVRALYGLPSGARPADALAAIAMRDHVGRITRAHPRQVDLTGGPEAVRSATLPLAVHHLRVHHDGPVSVTVRDARPPTRDLTPLLDRWARLLPGGEHAAARELVAVLLDRFLGDLVLADPDVVARNACLLLLDRATFAEPIVFAAAMTALTGRPVTTLRPPSGLFTELATIAEPLVGAGLGIVTAVPGPDATAAAVADRLARGHSVALPLTANGSWHPRDRNLSALIEVARIHDAPIVPVGFARSGHPGPLRRDHWAGRAWPLGDLERRDPDTRAPAVLQAVASPEWPPGRGRAEPDSALGTEIAAWSRRHAVTGDAATLAAALAGARRPGPLGMALRAGTEDADSDLPPWASELLRRLQLAGPMDNE
jgi:3-hydroxymyristoyl/3-hydroxydecanoyl-(acyl carrier protein) dehydratase/malonyl CoA-acyl carrier protein transacylase